MIREVKKRTKLEEVIPLDTPFVVHIGTTNVCNFKCKFCATGDDELRKKYNINKGFMDYELFCKCIDDLSVFPNKIKDILFHIDGEPLLHPKAVEMIAYAKKKNIANRLILFTNGALLNPKLSRDIMNAGIDLIQISVEGVSDERYEELVLTKVSYENILTNVAYLYCNKTENCKVIAKIIDCGLKEEEIKKFYTDFEKIVDECHVENVVSYIDESIKDTSLGIKKGLTTDNKKQIDKKVCTNPFYTMSINFDGRISACTCDWSKRTIVGDVNRESLLDIWNGKAANSFRIMQLSGLKDSHPACRECRSILNQIDNIDEFSNELLKKIKSHIEFTKEV